MSDNNLKKALRNIIFEHETRKGKLFDKILMGLIVLSVIIVILSSVQSLQLKYGDVFNGVQWVLTIFFTIEYLLRLYSAENRWKYASSFFGIVDLLAIIPSYYSIFFGVGRNLVIVRILRLLRLFRIFELGHFAKEGAVVATALRASRPKILVFLCFVVIAAILLGALMYMVEAEYNPNIRNIPDGIFWALVTLTTVGYGESIPVTDMGKILAALVMVLSFGIIAVPAGIVTAAISSRVLNEADKLILTCTKCGTEEHMNNSSYCSHCGNQLNPPKGN